MSKIFVNLVVKDVSVSAEFWTRLGFGSNPQFSDERSTNVILSDDIFLMLLERSRFADFVTGPVGDPTSGTSALYALSRDSREAVDELADAALAAGASPWKPAMDHGFMYGRSFQDPDGHVWELMWMDPAVAAGGVPDQQEAPVGA